MMLNNNGMVGGMIRSEGDAPTEKASSPVDAMLQKLCDTVLEARVEVQGLVNQLESVRQMAPRDPSKGEAREVGACKTEERLLEAIAGLRGMIEGVRATRDELRVW